MPLTLERTFRVRYTECDAYGHLNNAHYLRYMQETAFDATAAAGYSFEEYNRLGTLWLAYETEIEYLRPLRYDHQVIVKTWVDDFRLSRSRRMYEFRLAESGEVAARASTDWVYIDATTFRPVRIPQELMEAFFPEGLPEPAPRRPPFPDPPTPPPGMFTMQRRVEWHDIDLANHVNNAVYLAYVDECAFAVSRAHGWPQARMQAEGFGIIVRKHHIGYKAAALMDETLDISTYVYGMKNSSGYRYYEIRRPADSATIAQVHTRYVWIDLASGQPIRVPPHFIADFAPNIAEE